MPLSFLSQAATVNITAEFAADISQPQKNKFENTTPFSGFCSFFPSNCPNGIFSIAVPGIELEKDLDANFHDYMKDLPSMTVDGTPKHAKLTDSATGRSIEVDFRISLVGMAYQNIKVTEGRGNLNTSMNPTSRNPLGGCLPADGGDYAGIYFLVWGVPAYKPDCYARISMGGVLPYIGLVKISDFSLGYTLTTPDPLNVENGVYEGEVVYSLGGAGSDIDFHANNLPADPEMRIRLTATVKHAFNFKFAPGTENVVLGAKNGWQSWINSGRVPDSLNKEVPFWLTSSSSFSVRMTCGFDGGNQNCALQNTQSAEKVPMDIFLTLPGFKSNGSDVSNMLMTTAPAGHLIDPPGIFIVERRSSVNFKVRKPAVETMVKAPGSTWKGTVTLLFDTQTQ